MATSTPTAFFEGKGLGLTAALGFAAGFVVVGSLPTTDGTLDTAQPGALLFLDRNGNPPPASPFTNGINGPWGLAVAPASRVPGAGPAIFVSNVLSGTVVRLNLCGGCAPPLPVITSVTTIASGYTVQPNAAALVLGPTGLAYDPDADVLYIASTADNAIFAVAGARARQASDGPGTVVFSDRHLRGPLALIFVPNGDLIASNGDAVNAAARHPSSFIEFTTAGKFVREFNIDPVPGGAFGLAIGPAGSHAVRLAYVDDNTSTLTVLACRLEGC